MVQLLGRLIKGAAESDLHELELRHQPLVHGRRQSREYAVPFRRDHSGHEWSGMCTKQYTAYAEDGPRAHRISQALSKRPSPNRHPARQANCCYTKGMERNSLLLSLVQPG